MTSNRNNAGLANYRLLVSRIDDLATSICARYAAQITCRPGCSGCCRHLTLFPVEAAALVAALADLPAASRRLLCDRGEMPADGPCPLLQEDGRCLAYAARPIICRTHGLPLLTESDGVKNIDYCPENFQDITSLPGDAVMNLEILNRTLVAINAQFVTDTAVPVFRTQERFSMADIVRMACETGATKGREEMTLLDTILKANRKFVHPGAFPPLPKNPKKQFAIFTCMDTRLVDFLEPAMGIKRGDAKVIKNAGNTLVDPLHGGVIRSLVAAIFMLGVEEIFVIGHEDCGMSSVKPEELKQTMIARGISPEAINTHVPDLAQWLGAFSCPQENVSDVVAKIRSNPLIPADVPVHGLIFCPNDGHLDVIVNGYESNLFTS